VPKSSWFPGESREFYSASTGGRSAVSSDFAYEIGLNALLAMQKVEGSNPFSRFRKGLYLQVFSLRQTPF
jgi:hypothetical protein